MLPLLRKIQQTVLLVSLILVGTSSLADEQKISIKPVESVKIDGPFTITIHTGKPAKLSIVGDAAILPWVSHLRKSGELIISMRPGIQPHYSKRIAINLTLSSLHSLVVSNHGQVTLDNLSANNFSIGLNNNSRLAGESLTVTNSLTLTLTNNSAATLNGKARQLQVASSDHSKLIADDLYTKNTNITLSDHARATISTQAAVINESNNSALQISDGLSKVTAHLQDYSTLSIPQDNSIQSFINDDRPFGANGSE